MLEVLKDHTAVFLVGCGSCATACKTGGEQEVADMKSFLEENGKTVTGWCVPEETCQQQLTRRELNKQSEAVDSAGCLLVLSCGGGVQSVGTVIDTKPVYSALDSLFLGNVERVGKFGETCSMCGQCVLNSTAGICPVTRCAKGLLNGPCGGTSNGKCEVNPDNECAWVMIFNRLKERGQLDKLNDIALPKDHSVRKQPFQLDIRKR